MNGEYGMPLGNLEPKTLKLNLDEEATERFLKGELKIKDVGKRLEQTADANPEELIALTREKDREKYRALMEATGEFDANLDPELFGPRILELKQMEAQSDSEIEFGGGLNECRIMRLNSGKEGVYKPRQGELANIGKAEDLSNETGMPLERAQSIISERTKEALRVNAIAREWLGCQVDIHLDLDIVPATIVRTNSKGVGSVQEFVPGKTAYRFENWIDAAEKESLIMMAVLDFLTQQGDRHVNNILIGEKGQAVAIDNGSSFPENPDTYLDREECKKEDPLYSEQCKGCKTVLFRKLGGEKIPETIIQKLQTFKDNINKKTSLLKAMIIALGDEQGKKHWNEMLARIDWLVDHKTVPTSMYSYDK